MRRTDTVLPVEILNPNAPKPASNSVTGKRGRPPKAQVEETPEKRVKVVVGVDGKPLTGKGSGRKGGPGRGKKGPKGGSELQNSQVEDPESEPEQGDSEGVEVPKRGRQDTKFAKPVKNTAPETGGESSSQEVAGRRSTRNKKTA